MMVKIRYTFVAHRAMFAFGSTVEIGNISLITYAIRCNLHEQQHCLVQIFQSNDCNEMIFNKPF